MSARGGLIHLFDEHMSNEDEHEADDDHKVAPKNII
jgi:hypothetical protein